MPPGSYPAYLELLDNGELERRVELAHEHLRECVLCARHCRVNRLESTRGAACRTAERAIVSGYHPHHGEENVLRGSRGSGTIFFSSCNMRCAFCQNWRLSQQGEGREVEAEDLAGMMLELQSLGCHNVNLVSPSHVVAQILEAVLIAARFSLRLPLVYNSGGYDSQQALALLDGVVDIYMPDIKYGDSATARRYSRVRNYAAVNRAAVKEMHRQVGDLVLDEEGIAVRGLLVRHLVLPGGLAGTGKVLRFLAREVSRDTYLNIMDQYHPAWQAERFAPLDHRISAEEYRRAMALAERYGLRRLNGSGRIGL